MALSNKTELIKFVLSTINRETDQDLINNMDNFIAVVEEEFLTTLRVPANEYLFTATTLDTGRFQIPNNYLEIKTMTMEVDGSQRLLQRYTDEQGIVIRDQKGGNAPFGFYRWGDSFQLLPASAATIEMVYWGVIYSLNEAEGENFVLDMTPNVYVFGLLREVTAYLKDTEKSMYWDGRFNKSLNNLQKIEDIAKYAGSTPFVSPVG